MNSKKIIAIVVIAGCLILAGIITFARSGNATLVADLKGKTVWLKCNNPNCGAVYQMPAMYHAVALEKKQTDDISVIPGLKCQKCGEDSAFRVEKCEKCDNVFPFSAGTFGDFADRCPSCGFSKTEQMIQSGR